MNHHSLFPKNPFLLLLPVACTAMFAACAGSGSAGAETTNAAARTSEAETPSAPPEALADSNCISCENRQSIYTKTELESAQRKFKQMFVVGDAHAPIRDTVQRIPWKEIRTKGKGALPAGKGVAGFYISYGLSGNAFHPIFRFMYHAYEGANLSLAPKAFSLENGTLLEEKDPGIYEQAYRKNIRIDRLGDGKFSSLVPDDTLDEKDHPDPYATWFPYSDKLNNLMEQNTAHDTMLVVSCISDKYRYGAILALADVPEYRHLMTLHVGDGNTDLLSSAPPVSGRPYHEHAMDLGSMCPPKYPH